jgi:protein-S-isoprenylcysteine O-methyltransferase Ste14
MKTLPHHHVAPSERLFVWIGGAMFVASLISCASWYLFPLGRPLPAGDWHPLVFDAGLFSVFALHHSLLARESVKRWLTSIPPRLMRSVFVWTASLLLMLVCLLWRAIGGDLYHATGPRAVAHAAVQLAGLWVIARAVARIDPLELAGIRQPDCLPENAALQTSGPYRWVRHPLYLGWVLAVFGTAHMTGDRLAFAAISSIYLVIAVPWEERSLRSAFGDDYSEYAREVKWRIIPFVY